MSNVGWERSANLDDLYEELNAIKHSLENIESALQNGKPKENSNLSSILSLIVILLAVIAYRIN